MDKPYCKLCETKHWSYEPHVFKTAAQILERGVTKCNQCVTKDAEIARLRNQLKLALGPNEVKAPKRDRAAYMRKKRAEYKEKST
jgi:hypothetical protein